MAESPIGDWLARFIKNAERLKQGGHFAEKLFVEDRAPGNPLSLDEHHYFAEDIHWKAGWDRKTGEPPVAAAELLRDEMSRLGLTFERTDSEENPKHHVELRQWPAEESQQRKLLQDMAEQAILVEHGIKTISEHRRNPYLSFVVLVDDMTDPRKLKKTLNSLDGCSPEGWECVVLMNCLGSNGDALCEAVDSVVKSKNKKRHKYRVILQPSKLSRDDAESRALGLARGPWAVVMEPGLTAAGKDLEPLRGKLKSATSERLETEMGVAKLVNHKKPPVPKISIIVPVYNSAPYLQACLDSIQAQTFVDWECICIDDGSTDGSGKILDDYAYEHNDDHFRFRIVHQANAGVSAARQRGLDLARGEYVGWVDSDDIIEPSHFENLYQAIEEPHADLVWCGYVEDRNGVRSVCPMLCEESAQAMLEGILTCRIMGFLCGKLFRRAKIVESGARFPQYCQIMEDTYFLAAFLCANSTVKYVAQITYHYLVRGNSLSNQGGSRSWWKKVMCADEDICRLVKGRVGREVLVRRAGIYKSMMFANVQIPDSMFYAYHPDIRWLPNGVTTGVRRLQFFVATFHCRCLLRLLWMAKRSVKKLVRR